jgi:cysteinyl-tRNA synthetase
VPDYGLLARQSIESLQAGARVEVAEHKRSPIDFALWKFSKPDEPSWPSPWGDGRPGWHTECVVMSLDLLGDGFDLHGGGQDLAFPHHENERAQALASGHEFARHWMHNGFVEVGGEKMSKSLDNFDNLLDLLERVDPRAFRFALLQAHYRSPMALTSDTVDAALKAVGRLDALARRAAAAPLPSVGPDAGVLAAFRARMDDDLDTPGAMAVVFDTVTRANAAFDGADVVTASGLFGAVREACTAVGLELKTGDDVPAEAVARAGELDAARAAKDYALADTIRAELTAAGWVVETTKAGTALRRA